jgi:hypothetical protein
VEGSVLLSSGSNIFVQQSSSIVEANSTTGAVVATYELPTLPPDSFATSPSKVLRGPSPGPATGAIEALFAAPNSGDLIALQRTGWAVAVDDLSTGAVHQLSGYGAFRGATLGADGDIYTVAWRPNVPSVDLTVLRIDPSSLNVISTYSTGLSYLSTLNVSLASSARDNAIVYVAQGSATTPINSYLWTASAGGLVSLISVPANIAIDMSVVGDNVYLYGGPGTNSVAEVSLANLALTQGAPGLSSPAGTYVLSIS